MIKLLRIDLLVWGIICLGIVTFYCIVYVVTTIFFFIYDFEVIKWGDAVGETCMYTLEVIPDKNPKQTFLRFFDIL